MYTFSLFCRTLAILFLAADCAFAQNIVVNPTFDEGIDGWTTNGQAEWESTFGFDNGSLHLASQTGTASAVQCIQGGNGWTMIGTAHVYSRCTGSRVFYVLWASDESCSDTDAFSHASFATVRITDQWHSLQIVAPSSSDAHFIQLRLLNADSCGQDVWYDDVTLQYDDIFLSGFDF